MYCTKCGEYVPDGVNFCTKCGAPMTEGTAAPQQEQPAYEQPAYQQPVYEQPAYQQPVQPAVNGTPALVWGIVGLACTCGFVTSLLGIIFSAVGLGKAKKFIAEAGSLYGKAKVGKILSLIGLILGIVLFIVFIIYIIGIVALIGTYGYYY